MHRDGRDFEISPKVIKSAEAPLRPCLSSRLPLFSAQLLRKWQRRRLCAQLVTADAVSKHRTLFRHGLGHGLTSVAERFAPVRGD